MDGTVGMSCQPVEISGRNYMLRHGTAEAIRHDPAWNNGNYDKSPTLYMSSSAGNDLTDSPVRIQEAAPTMAAAKALYDRRLAGMMKNGDANNTLYEIKSIYDYSPEADLPKIKAHVLLINNVEDFADPPTLGTVQRAFKRLPMAPMSSRRKQGHARAFHALLCGGMEAIFGKIHGRIAASTQDRTVTNKTTLAAGRKLMFTF